jgi:hypothetical protein
MVHDNYKLNSLTFSPKSTHICSLKHNQTINILQHRHLASPRILTTAIFYVTRFNCKLLLILTRNSRGTSSFGVFRPTKKSAVTISIIAIQTAKSLTITRTYRKNTKILRCAFLDLPRNSRILCVKVKKQMQVTFRAKLSHQGRNK